WSDDTNGKYKIYYSSSSDYGKSFKEPIILNASDNNQTNATLSLDSYGNIHVFWEESSTYKNIYYSRSLDNGKSFSKAKRIGSGVGNQTNPAIGIRDSIHIVWSDDRNGNYNIYYAESKDNGKTFGNDILVNISYKNQSLPDIAVDEYNKAHIVWVEDNRICYASSDSFGAKKEIAYAPGARDYPRIATYSKNIFVVWQDSRNGDYDIYYANSNNSGSTFGTSKILNSSAGDQVEPDIAIFKNIHISWLDGLSIYHIVGKNSLSKTKLFYPKNNILINTSTPEFSWNFSDEDLDEQISVFIELDKSYSFISPYYLFQNYSSSNSYKPNISIEDGFWYWRARTMDSIGEWGNWSETEKFKIDTDIPETSLSITGNIGNNGWYINYPQIKLSSNEEGSIYYRIDGSSYSLYTSPIQILTDGNHKIEYYSVDLAGNKGSDLNEFIKVDTKRPKTNYTLSGTSGANGWYISNVTIVFDAKDESSGIEGIYYKIDFGNWRKYSSSFVIGDGEHILSFYSKDLAGNEEQINEIKLLIDTKKPETESSISGEVGNNGWFISNVKINLGAIDNLTQFPKIFYRINNGNWKEYIFPIEISEDGYYILEYYSIDFSGNIGLVHNKTIKIDKTPPKTNCMVGGTKGENNWYISLVNITFLPTDSNGIEATMFRFENSWFMKYEGQIQISKSGKHKIYFYSIDEAGNVENEKIILLNLDLIAPKAYEPASTQYTNKTTIEWVWEESDDIDSGIDGYIFSIGTTLGGSDIIGDAFVKEPYYLYNYGKDGITYFASVKAVDKAWNIGEKAFSKFGTTVDILPPSKPEPLFIKPYTNTTSLIWSWKESKDFSGVLGYYISIGSYPGGEDILKELWISEKYYIFNYGVNGMTYYAKVRAMDRACNLGEYNEFGGVNIDTKQPEMVRIEHSSKNKTIEWFWVAVDDTIVSKYNVNIFDFERKIFDFWTENNTLEFFGEEGKKYKIIVKPMDIAGNIGEYMMDEVIIDTKKPIGSLVINNGKRITSTEKILLSLSAFDESGVKDVLISPVPSFSDTTWESFSSTKLYSLPPGDGIKKIYVRYMDYAGLESDVYSAEIILDTEAPTLSLSISDGLTTYDDKIFIIGRSEANAKIFVNDELLCENGSFSRFFYLAEGTNVFKFVVEDEAGNRFTATKRVIKESLAEILFKIFVSFFLVILLSKCIIDVLRPKKVEKEEKIVGKEYKTTEKAVCHCCYRIIQPGVMAYRCECGKIYHELCIAAVMKCPFCGAGI
ncbi:MAG: chitobiase/beta-hexosaminidase C-terminal domain-containing protein, partial [Candidatus Thermoplasmatota archaeon]